MKKFSRVCELVALGVVIWLSAAYVYDGRVPKTIELLDKVLAKNEANIDEEDTPLTDMIPGVTEMPRYVTILGETHLNNETTLNFDNYTIEDKDQFVADLGQFYQLERCEMCYTNLVDEEMENLCNAFPDVKFVWVVHCAQWDIRTDAVAFSTMFVDYGWGPETSEDFEPLKYCTDLEALDIGHKSCTDISFIKDLKKLKILILAINRITDITPLEGLTNLTYLELFLNNIEDLSPLENLVNLEYLNLCHNRNLGDIDPILHYTNLKKLWISNCNLTSDEIALIKATYPNTQMNFDIYESVQGGWREGSVYYPMRNAFNNNVIDPMFYPKVSVETDESEETIE